MRTSYFSFLLLAAACGPRTAPVSPSAGAAEQSSPTTAPTPDTTMAGPALVPRSLSVAQAVPGAAKRRLFTQSNAASGNEVLVYAQAGDGTFSPPTHYPTGGTGTSAALGSQGAVTLSADGSALLAVNAGSNDVSVFAVGPGGLELTDRQPSGGTMPVSVAISGNVVFVVNAGDVGTVAGFVVSHAGVLTPIHGATRSLASAAGAAEVAVTPSARAIVVTEKATSCIETFALHSSGKIDAGTCVPSSGQTPFGFAFAPSVVDEYGDVYDRLLVSEAFGGAPNASAVSSYLLDGTSVDVADASIATEQTAACWVTLAHDGQLAYTTNTGSASVTGYRVSLDGTLTRLDADGRSAVLADGAKPTDAATSRDSDFLAVIDSGTHTLASFSVGKEGGLQAIGTLIDVPDAAAGLASE